MDSGSDLGFDMEIVSYKILMPGADSDNLCLHLHWPIEPCIVPPATSRNHATPVPIPLATAEIVELSGNDAIVFAQSQFSSDVALLTPGHYQWSAWLSAQGRVRHLFALLRPDPDRLLAWLPRGSASDMRAALSRFVMRAKVSMRVVPDLVVHDGEAESTTSGVLTPTGSGWLLELPGPTPRTVLLAAAPTMPAPDSRHLTEWQRADIDAGLPWIGAEVADLFTPQALGIERLGAISHAKGCYPGQEIVARLHYRGGNKRGCFRVSIDRPEPPEPGASIVSASGGSTLGTVLYAVRSDALRSRGLAVLPIQESDHVELALESGERLEILGPAAESERSH